MSVPRGPPDVAGLISLKVDNFPFEATADDVRNMFGKYGEVRDCYLPRDRITGHLRGFGFVRYATEEEAEAAIEGCNDKEMGDRRLRVSVAQYARPPLPDRGPPGPYNGFGGVQPYGGDSGNYGGRGGSYGGGDFGEDSRNYCRGHGGGPGYGGGEDVRPGDWMCPNCGFNVFASKMACFKCGAPKPSRDDFGGGRYAYGGSGAGSYNDGFGGGYGRIEYDRGGYGGDRFGGRGHDHRGRYDDRERHNDRGRHDDRGRYEGRGRYDGSGRYNNRGYHHNPMPYDDRSYHSHHARDHENLGYRSRSRSRDHRDDGRRDRHRVPSSSH